MEKDSVKDAICASNIALRNLVRSGIVVWASEVVSICKKRLSWIVEIDGDTFRGVVVISQKTGKVVTVGKL